MPVTYITFLVGCLAIAGVVPLRRFLEQGRHFVLRFGSDRSAAVRTELL